MYVVVGCKRKEDLYKLYDLDTNSVEEVSYDTLNILSRRGRVLIPMNSGTITRSTGIIRYDFTSPSYFAVYYKEAGTKLCTFTSKSANNSPLGQLICTIKELGELRTDMMNKARDYGIRIDSTNKLLSNAEMFHFFKENLLDCCLRAFYFNDLNYIPEDFVVCTRSTDISHVQLRSNFTWDFIQKLRNSCKIFEYGKYIYFTDGVDCVGILKDGTNKVKKAEVDNALVNRNMASASLLHGEGLAKSSIIDERVQIVYNTARDKTVILYGLPYYYITQSQVVNLIVNGSPKKVDLKLAKTLGYKSNYSKTTFVESCDLTKSTIGFLVNNQDAISTDNLILALDFKCFDLEVIKEHRLWDYSVRFSGVISNENACDFVVSTLYSPSCSSYALSLIFRSNLFSKLTPVLKQMVMSNMHIADGRFFVNEVLGVFNMPEHERYLFGTLYFTYLDIKEEIFNGLDLEKLKKAYNYWANYTNYLRKRFGFYNIYIGKFRYNSVYSYPSDGLTLHIFNEGSLMFTLTGGTPYIRDFLEGVDSFEKSITFSEKDLNKFSCEINIYALNYYNKYSTFRVNSCYTYLSLTDNDNIVLPLPYLDSLIVTQTARYKNGMEKRLKEIAFYKGYISNTNVLDSAVTSLRNLFKILGKDCGGKVLNLSNFEIDDFVYLVTRLASSPSYFANISMIIPPPSIKRPQDIRENFMTMALSSSMDTIVHWILPSLRKEV